MHYTHDTSRVVHDCSLYCVVQFFSSRRLRIFIRRLRLHIDFGYSRLCHRRQTHTQFSKTE